MTKRKQQGWEILEGSSRIYTSKLGDEKLDQISREREFLQIGFSGVLLKLASADPTKIGQTGKA